MVPIAVLRPAVRAHADGRSKTVLHHGQPGVSRIGPLTVAYVVLVTKSETLPPMTSTSPLVSTTISASEQN